jgi:phenylalanyl-tRNA synthetase alpha subunit
MSFLNKNNIIKEGFFTDILKFLRLYPNLKKNKKFKSKITDLNVNVKELETLMNQELKSYGSKKKIKLKTYSLKDFT